MATLVQGVPLSLQIASPVILGHDRAPRFSSRHSTPILHIAHPHTTSPQSRDTGHIGHVLEHLPRINKPYSRLPNLAQDPSGVNLFSLLQEMPLLSLNKT
eukprot:sb/3478564/